MFNERSPVRKALDNSKAGINIRLNQDQGDPFEVTVFLKKPGQSETPDSEAVSLAASGKLRLTIGEKGFVEIFAENGGTLQSGGGDAPEEDAE
jgi:hypothetical protein